MISPRIVRISRKIFLVIRAIRGDIVSTDYVVLHGIRAIRGDIVSTDYVVLHGIIFS